MTNLKSEIEKSDNFIEKLSDTVELLFDKFRSNPENDLEEEINAASILLSAHKEAREREVRDINFLIDLNSQTVHFMKHINKKFRF